MKEKKPILPHNIKIKLIHSSTEMPYKISDESFGGKHEDCNITFKNKTSKNYPLSK